MSEETEIKTEKKQETKKSNAGVWILITIIALLGAGVLGWLYSKESSAFENCQATNKEMQKRMDAMNFALSDYVEGEAANLKQNFKAMLATYDALIEKDASKTDSLQAQKDSIQKLLAELQDTKNRSYYQISKLKDRNKELRRIMNHYLITIDSLHTLNVNLTSRLDETSSQLEKTTSQRDKLQKINERSSKLLTKGARLNAFNFTSEALKYKWVGSGTKQTNRANNAEVLSCSFSIGENKIAPTGDKIVYLQITNPDGQILYKRSNNVVNIAGREILYTGKRKINYQGQILDMKIVYNLKGKEIPSGNYKVKIFADGALIGKDNFTLK